MDLNIGSTQHHRCCLVYGGSAPPPLHLRARNQNTPEICNVHVIYPALCPRARKPNPSGIDYFYVPTSWHLRGRNKNIALYLKSNSPKPKSVVYRFFSCSNIFTAQSLKPKSVVFLFLSFFLSIFILRVRNQTPSDIDSYVRKFYQLYPPEPEPEIRPIHTPFALTPHTYGP